MRSSVNASLFLWFELVSWNVICCYGIVFFSAALNLGCVPVRASRSQRHNTPRTYLRPSYQEGNSISPRFMNDNASDRNVDLVHTQTTSGSMLKAPQNVDFSRLGWDCNKRITPKIQCVGSKNGVEVERNASLNAVYPLYYGASFKPEAHSLSFHEAQKPDSVIIGVPVFSSPAETAAEGGCLQNLFPYEKDNPFGTRASEVAAKDNKGKGTQAGFDLSLRLGLFSDSSPSREQGSGYVTDSLGRRVTPSEGMPVEKEFSFFPMESSHNTNWLHRSKPSEESENQSAELVSRKRKISFSGGIGNDQFFWSQDSTNHFVGQMRRPGM